MAFDVANLSLRLMLASECEWAKGACGCILAFKKQQRSTALYYRSSPKCSESIYGFGLAQPNRTQINTDVGSIKTKSITMMGTGQATKIHITRWAWQICPKITRHNKTQNKIKRRSASCWRRDAFVPAEPDELCDTEMAVRRGHTHTHTHAHTTV